MFKTRTVQFVLIAVGLGAVTVAFWDVSMGGFYFTPLGIRVSSWEAYKPVRIAILAFTAAVWLHDRTAALNRTSWHHFPRWAPWIALTVSIASVVIAVRFGIFAAGGADGYGYVSQASLWTEGRLVAPDPLAPLEHVLGPAAVPLGYIPARTPGWIVPIYSPGLPLAMALASKIAGPSAVYYVVPVLGGLAVWLTYVLGSRVDRPITGMISAVLFAFSPLFVSHTLEPMSDVPATAWWSLAWVLAVSTSTWAPVGAGLAASAAILTRPNLVPLAVILVAVVAAHRPRVGRMAMFAAGSIPGCVIVGVINMRLYGSPLASGYGPLSALYAWGRWRENVGRYTEWLIDLNSGGVLLAFLAPFVTRVRFAIAMLAFFLSLLACYLFYVVFDTWPFLRFLLPALPLLFVLASAVFVRALERLPVPLRSTAVFLLCLLLPTWYIVKADSLGVFDIGRSEHRYVAVGAHIGRTLPPNTIVLTVIESGSVRLYGGRMTVRWDMIEPHRFDEIVEALRRAGFEPYLLLEDWELPLFRARFGSASAYGGVDWPPALEYRDISDVYVYNFADRARSYDGQPVATSRISYEQ